MEITEITIYASIAAVSGLLMAPLLALFGIPSLVVATTSVLGPIYLGLTLFNRLEETVPQNVILLPGRLYPTAKPEEPLAS